MSDGAKHGLLGSSSSSSTTTTTMNGGSNKTRQDSGDAITEKPLEGHCRITLEIHTSNPWFVKLSWLASAYSRPVLSAGDLED